jgi:hypothetical protein
MATNAFTLPYFTLPTQLITFFKQIFSHVLKFIAHKAICLTLNSTTLICANQNVLLWSNDKEINKAAHC